MPRNPEPHCFPALPPSVQSHPSPHWPIATRVLARVWHLGFGKHSEPQQELGWLPPLPSSLVVSAGHAWQLADQLCHQPARPLQVNSVNCNTSWKINLFMQFRDHLEEVLKGVSSSPSQQAPFSRRQMTASNDSSVPLQLPSAPRSPPCAQLSRLPLSLLLSFLAEEHQRPPHPVLHPRVATSLEHPFLSDFYSMVPILCSELSWPRRGCSCLLPGVGVCPPAMGVAASSLSPDMPVCTLGEEVAARPGRGWPNRQSSRCPCSEY